MGEVNLLYKSNKTLQNEGFRVFLYKCGRYLRGQLERFYYLRMKGVPECTDLADQYYYFGHPKCATNWIRSFLYHLCLRRGMNHQIFRGDASKGFVSPRFKSTFNLHVNGLPDEFNGLENNIKGFRMVRDPRDLLVSAYFSWKKSHYSTNDRLLEQRKYLQEHSMQEGLFYLMEDFDSFKTMRGWNLSAKPGVLLVRYEDLLEDELGGFKRIVEHLGLGVADEVLERCVEKSSFKAMSGKRKKGQENKNSHYRKGAAGDWVNYMPRDSDLYAHFMELHGPLMNELGYE